MPKALKIFAFTPCFLVCKCDIYHLCHIFTPQYLQTCDIFAILPVLDSLETNEIHNFQTPAHRKSAFLGDAFDLTDSNMKSVISFC